MQPKFEEEFTLAVLNKMAYIDRVVDDWIKRERWEFMLFLGNLYKPELIYEVGLNTMKKVLEEKLLEEGIKTPKLLAIVVYLLSGKREEIEVMKYQTLNLDIITLTDISLVTHADFSSEFFTQVKDILQTQFLMNNSN
jgi:hypothetical protein